MGVLHFHSGQFSSATTRTINLVYIQGVEAADLKQTILNLLSRYLFILCMSNQEEKIYIHVTYKKKNQMQRRARGLRMTGRRSRFGSVSGVFVIFYT